MQSELDRAQLVVAISDCQATIERCRERCQAALHAGENGAVEWNTKLISEYEEILRMLVERMRRLDKNRH